MYNKITNSEKRFSNHQPHKKEQNYEQKNRLSALLPRMRLTLSSCLKKSGPTTTHFLQSSAIVSTRAITSSRTAVL